LGKKNIGDKGAECLANALASNSTLQLLHLWNNNIGDRGEECLANALAKNYTLQELDLRWNNIVDLNALRRITSYLERNRNWSESFFGKLAQVGSWNDATNGGPVLLEALIPAIADLHQTQN